MLGWFWTALASTTASMTFFGIFLVGVVFSMFSIIMGGHGESDHDFGHDADHGDGHHGGDGHESDSIFNVGILSVRGVALLSTGFGGVGFLVHTSTGKLWFSSVVGLLSGYVFAFAVLYILKMFRAQQANSIVSMADAHGQVAMVSTSIPQNGAGEVRFVFAGQERVSMAFSDDGNPIPSGSSVRIERTSGGSVIVSPLSK